MQSSSMRQNGESLHTGVQRARNLRGNVADDDHTAPAAPSRPLTMPVPIAVAAASPVPSQTSASADRKPPPSATRARKSRTRRRSSACPRPPEPELDESMRATAAASSSTTAERGRRYAARRVKPAKETVKSASTVIFPEPIATRPRKANRRNRTAKARQSATAQARTTSAPNSRLNPKPPPPYCARGVALSIRRRASPAAVQGPRRARSRVQIGRAHV